MDEHEIIMVNTMWIYSDGFDFLAPGHKDNFYVLLKYL